MTAISNWPLSGGGVGALEEEGGIETDAGVAQLVERLLPKQDAEGSSPFTRLHREPPDASSGMVVLVRFPSFSHASSPDPSSESPVFPQGSLVDRLVLLALDEDLSHGDVTSRCTIPDNHQSTAQIIAREPLVMCGGPLLHRISELAGSSIRWEVRVEEGATVGAEELIAKATGDSRELLMLERVSLNFLQRLSGVATHTARMMEQSCGVVLLDTRKTTPGWRSLEKYATRTGGARNHRSNLSEMILIKNNHIDAQGGDLVCLFEQVARERPWHIPVECEVRTKEELERVLPFSPDFILLDNMSDELIKDCLITIRQGGFRGGVEVSGGVTAERFHALAALGVPAASLGSLTTQARSVDISMRVRAVAGD